MIRGDSVPAVLIVFALIAMLALLNVSGCYDEESSSQAPTGTGGVPLKAAVGKPLPSRGKQRLAAAPDNAVFGMIYINTKDNREYIFDGSDWVPHDQTVDTYYTTLASKMRSLMPQSEVLPTGSTPIPTGAHGLPGYISGGPTQHGSYNCRVCHYVGGVLMFDPAGLAVAPGKPYPSFEATGKTCSNVACHGMYSGTFSWYFPGGDGEPELKTMEYAGNGGSTTSWYATGGSACAACHGNPPNNGVWHSGNHAGGPTSASNQCQFCHPDATGSNGQGTGITNTSLHANGTVNVQATFRSSCFGCH